jgi:hypothetical protein
LARCESRKANGKLLSPSLLVWQYVLAFCWITISCFITWLLTC